MADQFYQQAGPQPPQGFNTTPDNRIYNEVVYNTVAEADAQRLLDMQAAGQTPAPPEVGTLWDLNANYRPGSFLPNPLIGVTDYGEKLITVGDSQSGDVPVNVWVNKNVVDYFIESRPDIFGHTSTFVKPYKVVNGELVEANPDDITPQDITNNAVYFYIGGATGGPNRERMAQLFQPNGETLIPIGDPRFYKGESRDGWKDAIATLAPIALMAFPGLGQTIGTYLGATTAATATALGNAVINTAIQVAAGVPIDKAIVNSAVTYGVSQYIPNLTDNPYIDNAIRSVAVAKLTGGDEQMALANSLIATGATDFLGNANITGDKTIDSGLVSGLTSSLQAAATGGDAGASFVQGFTRGASTKISQNEAAAERAASGAGFVGEAPFELGGVSLDTSAGGQQTTVSGGGAISGQGITTLGDLIVRLDNGETIDLGQTPLPTGEVGALRISMSRTSGQGEVNPLAVAQQTAKQRTVSPQQASDEMLTPIAQYFQIPNGSTFVRDLRNGNITEVVGEGSATKINGGALNLDFTTVGRVEGVPSNAQYAGVLYTTDLDAATDPYANFNDIDVSTLSLTRGFDPNVGMPGNLERVVNSDGSVVQIDKRFGDRSYFSPDGTLFDSYRTTYSKVNDVANTLASIATSAPGEWSESVANGLKVLGIPSDKLAAAADKLNQYGTNIAPAQVNALQAQWVRDVQDAVARNNYGREASDGVNLAKEIYNITLDNPIGGFTLVGKEIFQEVPEAAIGGVAGFAGRVAGMMGMVVSQVLESAGGTYKESIQRIEDEIQRGFRAPMSQQAIEAEARTNATMGGGITALLTALTPGGRTITGSIRNEMGTEGLETYLTARATGQSHEAAMQDAVVSGTIAGKVVGSMYAGDVASQKVGNLTGTQPETGVGATQQITINGAKIGRIAGLDDTGELVFVVTDDGNQLIIPSVNVLNNDTSREGQLVILNNDNQIVANANTRSQLPTISPQGIAVIPASGGNVTVGGGQVIPSGGTPSGGLPVTPGTGTPTGGTPGGGTPVGDGQVIPTGSLPVVTETPSVLPEVLGEGTADLGGANEPDLTGNTIPATSDGTVLPAVTPTTTPAYSANVAATPEVVAELLALKGLPASEGTIRILMTGNPTIAQVGQEIEIIAQMRRDQQPSVTPATQPTGTATVTTGQQTGPTIIADATQQTRPTTQTTTTTTPAVSQTSTAQQTPAEVLINARFTQAGKVASQQDIQNLLNQAQQMGVNLASENVGFTPQYQAWSQLVYDTANDIKRTSPTFVATEPSVKSTDTGSIDLTFDPGRVNIDTLEDTVQAQDTFSAVDRTPVVDTTPTFDTVEDTVPQDTVPTYGEDEDIIRFLGLDQQPTPTEPEAPPVEDTIGGGTAAGPADIAQEEQLAVAPKAVYTPKPGTRVVDTGTSILPTRVQLSEGMGDDVEGTGEEEQQPVWNVRSLKLRRALGI